MTENPGCLPTILDFPECPFDVCGILTAGQKTFTGISGRRFLQGASSDITELKQLFSYEKLNSEVLVVTATHDEFDMLGDMAGILMKHVDHADALQSIQVIVPKNTMSCGTGTFS